MPNPAEKHVAGLEVLVDGARLGPEWANAITEVKVVDSLTLPDMAVVRISDPLGEKVDSHPLKLGKPMEVKTAAIGARATQSLFKGQIAAVEPEFAKTGCTIVVRAYDRSYKLNRERKTRTFQQMTAAGMVTKVAQEAGLSARARSTNVVHEFFQQSNETDWAFAWRLALMHDYEVVVEDSTLHFRPANSSQGAAVPLKWQEDLISFRPRMSGIGQPASVEVRSWDPKNKATVNGHASSPATSTRVGKNRAAVTSALGGGTTTVSDRVAATTAEASTMAKSTLERLADGFVEADGVAFGDPGIKAGTKVQISNVGRTFAGTYVVTSSTHVYRGETGYQTQFQISGRSSRTLLELMRPPEKRDWSTALVVGLVSNNNDPLQMGRVRVTYPSLSDREEGAWARVATLNAGNGRGIFMYPQPGDEVVVGFEHGDTRRPVVLGALFNGRAKPGQELEQGHDGSLGVKSLEKVHLHSTKEFTVTSDQELKVKVGADRTEDVTGTAKSKASTVEIESSGSLTVKGTTVTIEASASLELKGATVNVKGSGPVAVKGSITSVG